MSETPHESYADHINTRQRFYELVGKLPNEAVWPILDKTVGLPVNRLELANLLSDVLLALTSTLAIASRLGTQEQVKKAKSDIFAALIKNEEFASFSAAVTELEKLVSTQERDDG